MGAAGASGCAAGVAISGTAWGTACKGAETGSKSFAGNGTTKVEGNGWVRTGKAGNTGAPETEFKTALGLGCVVCCNARMAS